MTLLVATTNPGKLREILPLLAGTRARLVTLAELPPIPEPEESGATFWENARLKALAYSRAAGIPTVAEDSGLVIDALGGEPGVHSARFLGADASYPDRFAEIFRRLRDVPGAPHPARFVTALAVADGESLIFETETRIEGMLAPAPAGAHGFGYDPIFFYPPFGKTTGELTLNQKAAVSHRARAFRDLRRALLSS
jgi:XTP/dITP diphosphohydrolase